MNAETSRSDRRLPGVVRIALGAALCVWLPVVVVATGCSTGAVTRSTDATSGATPISTTGTPPTTARTRVPEKTITTAPPPPTDPASTVPTATPDVLDTLLTCGGGVTFPASGLESQAGAEKAVGAEFDALRATLAQFADAFPGSSDRTWRLAGRHAGGVIFMAGFDRSSPPGWLFVEVERLGSEWTPGDMGECDPYVVLSAEFGPATWALDSAFSRPTPAATKLYILVTERACSSGRPATGRMSQPVIRSTAESVTITIGVRRLDGDQDCQGIPGTPTLVRLGEPLGKRTLLDGGHYPPAPPSPVS